MHVTIDFDGVLDHLDVLSNEMRKSRLLVDVLRKELRNTLEDDIYRRKKIEQILENIEAFEKNVSGRKELLIEIVSLLKSANYYTKSKVTEIGYTIAQLSDGGQSE